MRTADSSADQSHSGNLKTLRLPCQVPGVMGFADLPGAWCYGVCRPARCLVLWGLQTCQVPGVKGFADLSTRPYLAAFVWKSAGSMDVHVHFSKCEQTVSGEYENPEVAEIMS